MPGQCFGWCLVGVMTVQRRGAGTDPESKAGRAWSSNIPGQKKGAPAPKEKDNLLFPLPIFVLFELSVD